MLSIGAVEEAPVRKISEKLMLLDDGSVVNQHGQILWFSVERFYQDICLGDCCFICGVSPQSAEFNDEHIIPDWLLKRHGLYSAEITLPNQRRTGYDRYKVPCCKKCNSLMGDTLEKPISEMLSLPYSEGIIKLKSGGLYLVMIWLHLIFVKTHIKDTYLRLHLDERKPDLKISSLFDARELHHAHTIARSIFTETRLGEGVCPTLHVYPCVEEFSDGFDYLDLTHCLTMAIRTNDYIFIMSLDDAGMADAATESMLEGVDGPINPLQLREIVARLGFANLWLESRPDFYTRFADPVEIGAVAPSYWSVEGRERSEFGELLAGLVGHYLRISEDPEAEIAKVRTGETTFLYDENGRFHTNSLRRTPQARDSE